MPVDLEFTASYVRFPLLLKLQTSRFFKPHFLIGLDLGLLLKARDERFSFVKIKRKITDELSSFDLSLNLGIGKKFELTNTYLILEARFLKGFSKYSYFAQNEPRASSLGEWRNNLFQLILGIQFK